MAKKNKPASIQQVQTSKFDLESQPYYVPVVFLIIFIALLVLFSDFIFSDQMLAGSDMIQAGIFFRSHLVDYVTEYGSVPQWNPYIFGGMPYVEAFHGDIFYPLSIIKYVGSIYRMLGYVLFLHIFLAGLFMYFTARQFKLGKTASLLSGICYMFASYLISLVAPGHDGKIFVTTLFPLTILFLDRGFEAKKLMRSFFNFSMLGLVIGFIILSPHPQMSYFSLWAISFYAAFKIIYNFIKDKNAIKALRPAALTTYAVIIGLLLSAIQFYPGYLYTSNFSPRTDSKQGWEWATSWSMHEEEAFSLLIPEFAGVSTDDGSSYYWGENYFKDNSEAVGVVSIFMALLGFFFYRRKESYFFGGLALFALIYALGATTPLFKVFFYLIPKVKALRAPSMIMFLFSFSSAILAGMGLQTIIDKSREWDKSKVKKFYYLLFGLPAFLFIIALVFSSGGKGMIDFWVSLFHPTATAMLPQGVTKLDLAYRNLGAIQSGAWLAFFFTALTALFIWLYQSKKNSAIVLTLLLAIPIIDGVRFNDRFVSVIDQEKVWAKNVVVDFFEKDKSKYRVMNFVPRAIPEDYLPHFDIDVVAGYHGNQLRWYDKLFGGPAKRNQGNARFLNLVGAEYILVPGGQVFPEGYFGEQEVTVAANFGQLQILKNNNALPRFFFAKDYKVLDTNAIYEEVINGTIDLSKTVLLEEQPQLAYEAIDSLNIDKIEIGSYQNESVKLLTELKNNRLLVLTDNYYEAWHVSLDGEPGHLLRSYGTFRAVEVPAGTKEVLFEYNSKKYETGKTVSTATSIFLLLVFGFYIYRRKENKPTIDEE